MRGDELADIRCDGRVVLRAVRAVARDDDWATAWPSSVDVPADGDRLVVDLDLEAVTDSSTNRIGLVVLHPPQLASTPLQVTHPDGSVSELAFPVQVSPHQPAKDIAGLAWEAGGLPLRLDLDGDVFEMEDQRNWTDASYKTYSRPLDLPFPYTVGAGDRVRQQLVLFTGAPTPTSGDEAAGAAPAQAADRSTEASDGRPVLADRTVSGDRAGTGPEAEELTWRRGRAVPVIGTGHLDLELADPDWPQRLDAALTARDELALWVVSPSPADPAVLAELGSRLTAAVRDGTSFRFLGIADAVRHVTTPELAAALRKIAPEGVPLVAGARSHFTELNREWETVLAAEPEALAFATTPLFHTLESEQLIEAVAMQRLLAEQLTTRVPEQPVHVGPITLRPRFANVATRPQPVPAPAPPVDPRAGTVLHEAWTIASAAALSIAGVASLTYEQVPDALAALGRADRPLPTVPAEDSLVTARSADGLVWAIGDGTTLLLANLSGRCRSVHASGQAAPIALAPAAWTAQ